MDGVTTYALCKKVAASAVSGVKSMSVDGQTLKINTNNGEILTINFPTPSGKDGVSVTDISVNAKNQIVFTMSDDTTFTSGIVPTVKGDRGDKGSEGKSAYDVWISNGNTGTEEDFLNSLKPNDNVELGTFVENEYIDYKGAFKTYKGWHRTDYVELPIDATKLIVNCNDQTEANSRYNAFYDVNKTFIARAYYGINTIPCNAKYIALSCKSSASISIKKVTNDIEITKLNKDIENALVQSSSKKRTDTNEVFTIAHISDIHGSQDLFNRVVEFTNYYISNLKLIINTGDYVNKGQEDFIDLMGNAEINNVPFYNVIGNHDQYVSDSDRSQAPKASTYTNVITKTQRDWQSIGVTYMSGDNSMTYYKDFANSKIRLIVLDDYYDIDTQATWLASRLEEAKTKGYAVITAKHEKTDNITTSIGCFNSKDVYTGKYNTTFETAIKAFIDAGGIYICNLCGHEHIDEMGYTSNGILNVVAECVTDDIYWQNCKRDKGTKTYDCFNIISVDTNQGLLKIVRVGDNTDIYMHDKKYLCYDYINKKII